MTNIEQSSYSFKFASWSIAGLALSLGVSKAGLSVFSVLLLLAFVSVWALHRSQFSIATISKVNKVLLALFVLGIVCSLLSYGGIASTKDFATKGSLFLVLPMSLFFLQYKTVRTTALYALLLGGMIACSYSVFLWLQLSAAGVVDRVASFWDLGRWGEYLCYFLMLLTPLLFSTQSKKRKTLFVICYAFAFITLLISGMRGPLLAVMVATGGYFVLFNRRLLAPFLLLFVAVFGVVYLVAPTLIESTIARFVSIFDFSNFSNLARINMWMYALDFFHNNLVHDFRSVLFGSGFENLAATFEPYLDATNQRVALVTASGGEASFNDHHNAFLNVLNRMGLVYMVGMIMGGYVVVAALVKKLQQAPTNPWYQSALVVLLSYLVIGVFYSNELNYQTLMAAFMCALAVRFGDAKLKQESQSHV
ncbi:O-antigen ligase family protein [Vibrio maritimus]|uniref:O-antigen ligase family protein n=1 Tax=Vibrio maritimus TaxID=990268 RepID=UPI00406946D5